MVKWLYPASATCTSHIGSIVPKALIQVGSTYYYAVIDSATTFKVYKATSLLVGDETLLGTITSTLANPNPVNIELYCYNQAIVYVSAAFTDFAVAAGVNDVQYFTAKYTIATSTWAAIGNVTINSGIALVEVRTAYILGQWVTAAGNHYLITQHHRKAGGNTYYRTTCYSSSFGASSTMDSAVGASASGSGGYWNETAAKYYWLYYESGGVGWIFKYATTAPTINNDDPSIAEPTLNVVTIPSPETINYASLSNGSRIIVTIKDYAFYDINNGDWIVESYAGTSNGAIGYLDNEPYYIAIDTSLYFRLGNTWFRIWNSFTAAHDKDGCAGSFIIVNNAVMELAIRSDYSIISCPVKHGLFQSPKVELTYTPNFVPFDRQCILLYNDSDEWCGAYILTVSATTGGLRKVSGIHIMLNDLVSGVSGSITASTADEHLSSLITDFCETMTEGSLDAYATDYDITYDCSLIMASFLLSVLEKAIVFWSIEGEISFNDGTDDWGDDLKFGTQAILHVEVDTSYRKPRYVRCKGGYVNGVQIDSIFPMYSDGPVKIFTFSNIVDQGDLDQITENLAEMLDVDAIFYTVTYAGAVLLQPGTQITFSYSPLSIAEAQFYVISASYNLCGNVNTVVLCTHLVYPEMETITSDIQHFASAIQKATNDYSNGSGITPKQIKLSNTGATINEFSTDGTLVGNSDVAVPTEKATKTYVDAVSAAKISDTAWAATWDNVTTIAPSKNAVYDAMPHIYMFDTDPNAWAYSFTSATNGGTVDLDLDNSTSTETNCAQVNDALATYVCPSWATHVLVMVLTSASTINAANGLVIRENGNANAYMGGKVYCGSVAGYINCYEGWIRMDANKVIEIYVMRGAGTISGWIMIKGYGYFPAV